jgi:hypothetical protein
MELQDVVPWGRNLAEYQQMFALSSADLTRHILGSGDGPASFNAEMLALGHHVVSIDPIYQFTAAQIRQRVESTYDKIIAQVKVAPQAYVWRTFANPDALGRSRLESMERFLEDYDRGLADGRYLAQFLPKLDLHDRQFELCLCSHFLFLYSQHLDLAFHQAAIAELLRVADEVRIFPLLTLQNTRSAYLEPVLAELAASGHHTEIVTVDYEFQRGANQMLKIIARR